MFWKCSWMLQQFGSKGFLYWLLLENMAPRIICLCGTLFWRKHFSRVLLMETTLCGALVLQEPLFWNPYFQDGWIRRPRKSSVFVKLVNLQHICCVRLAHQKWPYPSSLSFTAHSSISPKASKRRFSSVRVQSDLSRPTYTTRLSSCSLKGKTDRKARDYRWKSCFFVINRSWSRLWILLFCHRLSPWYALCDWFSLLTVIWWSCRQSTVTLPQQHNSFFPLSTTHQPEWFLSSDVFKIRAFY